MKRDFELLLQCVELAMDGCRKNNDCAVEGERKHRLPTKRREAEIFVLNLNRVILGRSLARVSMSCNDVWSMAQIGYNSSR